MASPFVFCYIFFSILSNLSLINLNDALYSPRRVYLFIMNKLYHKL